MKEQFSLRTVRKKVMMISKIAGIVLMLSYLISTRLQLEENLSFLLWVVFVLLLIMAIDYLLGRFISDPIRKIGEMAHRTARLDFSEPCRITSKDEFGELADNLNRMSENLQLTLEKLEEANVRLEKDVRQEKKLLKERKELTDRLSHEMKTPLGIIRAYAEGIQDETNEEKRQSYAATIISETERMSALIETLLDLSALENGAVSLTPERFDFIEFVETIAGRLLVDMPDTGFVLQYELPAHKVFVDTDRQRMEQVINNLIVNAKKNVFPNGVLRLAVVEQDDKLCFSIYNQGHAIPSGKLSKIWEAFYRDQNVKYNGSGLGLAIAAQILSMQDLEYGAENEADGVRFFFTIPITE
ncbi:MAG: HAMP domain-containing histidine kinase [Lachnospiraceae bacterium]|nr:HAMP domain-containing histidine kinase [Lachnospiraceae bacterium]